MANILIRNEHVYKCDTCTRSVRVPANSQGIEIVQRCIITANCLGKMQRVTNPADINSTPSIPPEVTGLTDWTARNVLFTYKQAVKSTTWNIAHDLENNPTVFVYVTRNLNNATVLVQVEPKSINIIDLNNIQVTFDQAESGLVQCIALSSQNTATPSTLATVNAGASSIQISNQGELSFATLDASPYVNISVVFSSPSSPQPILIEYLNIKIAASALSPWRGVNYVIVNSKRYYIRSINMLTYPPAPLMFQSGMISSGAIAYFPNSTIAGQLLVLLANNPQTTADRIYNRYIDTASAHDSTSQLYYNSGNLYAASEVVKNTYPPIIVA